MRAIFKKIFAIAILVLVLIQFIKIDTNITLSNPENDFIKVTNAPLSIEQILVASCYDCHSDYTVYTWYSKIAPISWYLDNHIKGGKKHLNFSNWSAYTPEKKAKKIKENIENLEENKMPLKSYTLIHREAKLTPESKQALVDWFRSLE